jgi:hypothetical protein|tara:strand:- start:45 stop:527 length:483 start_codon:yes stop_codon:yes gene_type:complete
MSTRVKTNPVVMGVQTKNVTLIKSTTYTGEDYHYANGTTYNQVVKQIIAAKFGKEVASFCQFRYESFSMGNSFDIYVNPLIVSKEVFQQVKDLLESLLQYGSFNSYEDYYEVKSDRNELKFAAPCGRDISISMKYVTVHHKPKYGTKAYEAYEEYKEALS